MLSTSLMCGSFLDLKNDISKLNKCADMLHIDIMDGHFVQNITFGPDITNQIASCTDLPLDIHIMAEQPELFLSRLNLKKEDFVTIHAEINEKSIENSLKYLHANNINVGLALNPKTDFEKIIPYLDDIDMILFMFVEPGFAGARSMPNVINKIKKVNGYLQENGYDNIILSVDGGITIERAKECKIHGVSVFVGGTSAIYKKDGDIYKNIETFKKELQ